VLSSGHVLLRSIIRDARNKVKKTLLFCCYLITVCFGLFLRSGPSPGFRSMGAQKPQGVGRIFLNTTLDVYTMQQLGGQT